MKKRPVQPENLITQLTIVVSFCLCTLSLSAQDKKQITSDSAALVNCSASFIDSNFFQKNIQSYSSYTYPFDSIIFCDVRYDTTTIGVTNRIAFLIDKNRFRYVTFSMGLSGFLNAFLNNQKNPENHPNANKLVCYIKKFRVTELDSTYEYNQKKKRQVQIKSAIDAFYFHNNLFYPAFRIDTIFSQLYSENKDIYSIIDSLLRSFCERASKIDTARVLRRKLYSRKGVDSIYQQRFTLPILQATGFKKGVYTSKEEFLNNAPSITEYEWKPEKKVNILYTKDANNQWTVTRKNVFGFCDGVNIWLRVEESFYPAFRKEKSFEFIAPLLLKRMVNNKPATVSVPIGNYIYFISIPSKYSSIYYQDKSIYQIDMENGSFY